MTISTQTARIQTRLQEVGIPAGIFAKACGVSASTFSTALRGQTQLSGPLEARLAERSVLLVELAAALRPFSLPDHAEDLKGILDYVAEHPDAIAALGVAISGVFNSSGSQS